MCNLLGRICYGNDCCCCCCSWLCAGYVTGFVIQTVVPGLSLKWRVMLGIGIVPPVVIVLCLTFLPESPRWLIARGYAKEGYQVRHADGQKGGRVFFVPAHCMEQ